MAELSTPLRPGQEGDVTQSPNGPKRSFFTKKIVRIFVGVFLLLQLILFSVFYVLPKITKKSPEVQATLTYWGLWESAQVISSAIADFERQHPNIKIKYEKQDIRFLGNYVPRLQTRIQNGTGPDVFRFHNSWLIQMKGFLLPFPSDVVQATEINTDKYYDIIQKDLSFQGAYYGIPLHVDTLVLFVNPDIFKAAGITSYPTTWDEVSSVSRQLTVRDANGKIKTAGIALGTFDNIAHAPDIISLLFTQNGANIRNLEGESKKNATDALEFFVSFAKGDDKVWDQEMENSKLAFVKGNLAMYIGYSWDLLEMDALNPKLNALLLPIPHLPGRQISIASYWAEGISIKTKYPKEAFEFLTFLSKKETLQKLYEQEAKTRQFGELYPRTDMADLLKDKSAAFTTVNQARNAQSTLFSSDTFDGGINVALNAYLGNAVRSMLSNTSSASSVETLSQGIDQVLKKYEQ